MQIRGKREVSSNRIPLNHSIAVHCIKSAYNVVYGWRFGGGGRVHFIFEITSDLVVHLDLRYIT